MISADIIAQAESYSGIRAGIARLEDVLFSPSYRTVQEDPGAATQLDDVDVVVWLPEARSVLVLGLKHPPEEPRLDWWERGDTLGNRRLREISESLKKWLRKEHDLNTQPLPYHVENEVPHGEIGNRNVVIKYCRACELACPVGA